MAAVDENLGDGGPAVGSAEHLVALPGHRIDLILFVIGALLLEQALGAGAIGATELGIDLDSGHHLLLQGVRGCVEELCGPR